MFDAEQWAAEVETTKQVRDWLNGYGEDHGYDGALELAYDAPFNLMEPPDREWCLPGGELPEDGSCAAKEWARSHERWLVMHLAHIRRTLRDLIESALDGGCHPGDVAVIVARALDLNFTGEDLPLSERSDVWTGETAAAIMPSAVWAAWALACGDGGEQDDEFLDKALHCLTGIPPGRS